ncbi:MAG: tRNA (guanosine(46)-N7)-methyltransferase TrmB [Gammaproteobacteria bacterium]|nr:tRNA (guanosine(46)-N7)-methyltransferase TrmB [Gammaproteobacteria bacterium]HAN81113.1 tRNA (guanosine(46)-N7)-methyltransferase TrmB [Gammaproteobacteria bacterium]
MIEDMKKRTIRSFVLRPGRMTDAQNRSYLTLWGEYGVVYNHGLLDLRKIFGRKAPIVLEIGFGMGDSLLRQTLNEPDRDFIGVEVHKPGVGRLMNEAKKAGVTNLRVICEDAVEVLSGGVGPQSLEGVQIYFPDPWHKKRHHKRRIVQPDFINLLAHRVRLGGFCHLATDWVSYAEWMVEMFNQSATWHNTSETEDFVPRPERRPITKFETRGERLGHDVFDLLYQRKRSDQHL